MKPHRFLPAAIVCALLAQDSNQPIARVTTRLVELNVIVRDKSGPVSDLAKEDFTILENGKPRKIAFFSKNVAPPESVAQTPQQAAGGVVTNRPNGAGETPVNVTVVLLDALNTEIRDQQFAKQEFLQFLKQIRPEDRVAVYTLGTKLHVLNDFTSDAKRLAAVVNRYSGENIGLAEAAGAPLSDAPDGIGTDKIIQDAINNHMNDLVSDYTVRMRAETTAAAMEAIANHIGHIPGRKSLIWISASFPFVIGHIGDGQTNSEDTAFDDDISGVTAAKKKGGMSQSTTLYGANDRDGSPARTQMNFTEAAMRATRALNNANVAVYAVDARGLTGMVKSMTVEQNYGISGSAARTPPKLTSTINTSSTALHTMADSTGGLVFQNTNGIRQAIQSAIQDGEVTYTLGFYPESSSLDSKYHNLKVQVKRKDVELRYRRGYLAVPDSQLTAQERGAQVRDVLWSPLPATAIGLIAGLEKGDKPGTIRMQVALEPRDLLLEKKGDRWTGALDLVFAQRAADGSDLGLTTTPLGLSLDQQRYELIFRDGLSITKMLDVAPHAVELRVVVFDRGSGKVGSLTVPLN
ncbi:MAG TPA: VWA domain-containing protein [Bryobacteraceae bacterium]|nr:VWA domain-containing protein [Bryobacteraceae bacterium]